MVAAYKRLSYFLMGWFSFILLLCGLFYILGIHINYSRSVPVGFYRSLAKPLLQRGDYVYFCPIDNMIFSLARDRQYINTGPCKGNYGYLIKRVSAIPGDIISITKDGVFINGLLQAHSKPLSRDGNGRLISFAKYVNYELQKDEFLLLSPQSDISFDSRYFGIVHKKDIISYVAPILTW